MACIVGKIVESRSLMPLADAVVTATGPEMEDEKTVVTDERGIFILTGITGPVRLHLEKEGHVVTDDVAAPGQAVHLTMRKASKPSGEKIE